MDKFNPPHYIRTAIYGMACTLAEQDGNKELQAALAQMFVETWEMGEAKQMSEFADMVENYGK